MKKTSDETRMALECLEESLESITTTTSPETLTVLVPARIHEGPGEVPVRGWDMVPLTLGAADGVTSASGTAAVLRCRIEKEIRRQREQPRHALGKFMALSMLVCFAAFGALAVGLSLLLPDTTTVVLDVRIGVPLAILAAMGMAIHLHRQHDTGIDEVSRKAPLVVAETLGIDDIGERSPA